MKKHIALLFCLFAAGCTDTDWDRALNYVYPAPDDADLTSDASPQPAAPAQPATTAATPAAASAPAAPANADFCRAVATRPQLWPVRGDVFAVTYSAFQF